MSRRVINKKLWHAALWHPDSPPPTRWHNDVPCPVCGDTERERISGACCGCKRNYQRAAAARQRAERDASPYWQERERKRRAAAQHAAEQQRKTRTAARTRSTHSVPVNPDTNRNT